jgi:hypothetical protein
MRASFPELLSGTQDLGLRTEDSCGASPDSPRSSVGTYPGSGGGGVGSPGFNVRVGGGGIGVYGRRSSGLPGFGAAFF